MTALFVIAGGMIGAPLRYLISQALRRKTTSGFPWGTLTVNTLGSFLLAAGAAVMTAPQASALWGAGLCGALTTYSTLSYETVLLWEARQYRHAVLSLTGNIAAGLCAAGVAVLLIAAAPLPA